MKSILLLLAATCLLLSCNRYQYLTVSSTNLEKSEKRDLVYENDVLKVEYRFTEGMNRIGIKVQNKSDEPIEVDWQKSSIILPNSTFSYHNSAGSFIGRVEENRLTDPLQLSGKDINGVISLNEPVQFIPPQASVQKNAIDAPFLKVALGKYKNELEKTAFHTETGESTTYKLVKFEKGNSPATFRSYLNFRIGRGEQAKEFFLDHQFYVSESWRSASGPEFFTTELSSRGDIFYYRQ